VAVVGGGVGGVGRALVPGPAGDTTSLGRIVLPPAGPCSIPDNAGATLGEAVRLAGYAVKPDGVRLCWEALRPLDADYTVFVHVLDASGALVAAGDGPPNSGLYPTTAWATGERVDDWHPVVVPVGAWVEVGLYRLDTGERLAVDGTGATAIQLAP
jgi:hypothetical protein